MKVTITSIELKNPFKFFALAQSALQIIKQLTKTDYVKMKKRGIWTKHYTMTLWKNEEDLKKFAKSGAHLAAMRESGKIAKEIRTYTYDADELPSWVEAKELLKKAKAVTFS